MRRVNSIIYAVLGGFTIIYGVANLFFPTFMVPEAARSFPLSHILREQAAAAIFMRVTWLLHRGSLSKSSRPISDAIVRQCGSVRQKIMISPSVAG